MKTIKILALIMIMTIGTVCKAHDFIVTLDGQKVYFNIVSNSKKTVEITYNGSIADNKPTYYEGELRIPSKIRYNGTTMPGIRHKPSIHARVPCGECRRNSA